VTILYEGVVIGQGHIHSMGAARAFVEIRNIPLDANTFLELIIDTADNTQVSTPVRVLRNTGEGLEVELENTDRGIPSELLRNKN
jgi:hypothetical protein